MAFQPENMAIMFYRLGWKDRMKGWSKEKKMETIKEISDISLYQDITTAAPERKFKLKSSPSEEFSGLQLYAGMIEIGQDLGIPVAKHETDKMVEAMSRKKVKEVI
jgi:hypothetical protein